MEDFNAGKEKVKKNSDSNKTLTKEKQIVKLIIPTMCKKRKKKNGLLKLIP